MDDKQAEYVLVNLENIESSIEWTENQDGYRDWHVSQALLGIARNIIRDAIRRVKNRDDIRG